MVHNDSKRKLDLYNKYTMNARRREKHFGANKNQ